MNVQLDMSISPNVNVVDSGDAPFELWSGDGAIKGYANAGPSGDGDAWPLRKAVRLRPYEGELKVLSLMSLQPEGPFHTFLNRPQLSVNTVPASFGPRTSLWVYTPPHRFVKTDIPV